MAHYGKTNQGYWKRACSQLIVFSKLLVRFHSQNHIVLWTGTNLMCNITYPKFPGKICEKNVSDKDKAVQCDLSEFWVHIKCNNVNCLDYRYFQNSNESWYCIECCSTIFPFNSLFNNKNFLSCFKTTDNKSRKWS